MRHGSLSRAMALAFGLSLAPWLHADGPVLHEFIPPDPAEDLALEATTPDGRMPAAVQTPSGIVPAPSERREQRELAYGGASTPDSVDASYRIDPDTTQPDVVSYDDPFVPAITPFKRLYAYDAVDESGELVVGDRKLTRLPIGGGALPSEDQFYGDLLVDVIAGVPVRIPSVGAQARVLAARVEPPASFELLHDGADNWFLLGTARQRLRLVVQLAISRAVFGSPFADVDSSRLRPHVPALPEAMAKAAREVVRKLGLSEDVRPRDAVSALVSYFRGFAPSDERPKARAPAELYRELALSQKGVCRHRAFAFVVSALAIGIPARLVRNEAHAWVEVFDGSLWHRIDLGGAAGRFEVDRNENVPQYGAPPDPFAWPEGAQRTEELVQGSTSSSSGGPGGSASGSASAQRAPRPAPSAPAPASSNAASSERPAASIELGLSASESRRGAALGVSGTVTADGEACPFARVDITLRGSDERMTLLGAVPTDEQGRFQAKLTVPLLLDVGEYAVVATTPGAGRCGASGAP